MRRIKHVTQAMISYFNGDVKRINHFLKVHAFAKLIGELEGLEGKELITTINLTSPQ
jgi:uncharacterized protein